MAEVSSWLLSGTGGNAASSGQSSVAKLEFVVMIEFVMAGLRQQDGLQSSRKQTNMRRNMEDRRQCRI